MWRSRVKPIISPDVRNDPLYINAREETRSEMVAPIISNDEVIGVFDLESDELNAYSDDDLEVLMMLASQVAIIIEKVMLHEQLIEKKRLEGQLEVAGRCSWSCCRQAIRSWKGLTSAPTTFRPKKFPETITTGCQSMTTRSVWW